jgi:hypothetical protein
MNVLYSRAWHSTSTTVDEILAPVELINVKLCTYSMFFSLYLKQKHKKCSFAQYMKEFKWIELWILKEIGQSAMRAQVETFAGWPMPSQIGRREAPKKICKFKKKQKHTYWIPFCKIHCRSNKCLYMKGKLALDTLWKVIFTIYFVQMVRFETESTLQMADYQGCLPINMLCVHRLSTSNLSFIDKHLLCLQWSFSLQVRNYLDVFYF